MEENIKKPRRFLKMLGRVGEIIAQEVLLKILRGVVSRIGGKKNLPSILFLFLSISLYGQFPININKQRLGYQTTADGLVWRGSLSDTSAIQPVSNQYAWVILDTVNLKFYSFDFTSNVWNQLPSGTTIDTTSLSNRINLKLNISDTASMLDNYALKYYVDSIANDFQDSINDITNGYFKQQFLSVTSDTLFWTRSVQLPTDENLLLAFRNGQILNNSQYETIDTNKIKIVGNSYKIGENYTIVYIKGGGGSGSGGSSFDTTTLNLQARLDLKLNISDTASMLANYATKAYADTSGRFYARQDFTNVSSATLTWTQSDTLVVGGVTVIQVYRNGQILLPSQYTIPTNASVVIGATAYKSGENYTVIFPRGGGAGSGSGGSGSLTSISGGTGITVNPNPITTTGTVSADTSFLFTQSDTLSLNLSNRFALKLNAADTASLSNRINAKGTGTVTSVASGFGLLGGTITTTGTLRLDTTTIYARLQDSINVAIGGDTIKILKQEYTGSTSSILTWTTTSKFPIQQKAYILVFRNGQLLNNDQYNLTDTNKITIVSTSFKSGANYTVATVSGIGSVGTGVYPNPVYPEAGIALSTGTAWASSITNNSTNWNTAYNDKINSLAVTGTATKTITLTQQDGGTVSGTFSDNGTVTSVGLTAPTGFDVGNSPITSSGNIGITFSSGYSLPTNTKQSQWDIAYNDKIASLAFTGTDTKTLTLNQTDGGTVTGTFTDLQGVTGSGTIDFIPKFNTTTSVSNSVIQESSGNIGIGLTPTANLELSRGKFIMLNSRDNTTQDSSGIMLYETGTKSATDINFGAKIMYDAISDNLEIKMKNYNGTTLFNPAVSISIPRTTGNVNIGTSLAVTGNITEGGNNVLNNLDTVNLSSRIDGKVGLTGNQSISGTKTFNNLVTLSSNLILSGSYSSTNKLLGKNSSDGVGNITVGSGLNLTNDVLTATQTDTTSLSNRINAKVGLTGNETIVGEKSFSGMMTLNGGLKGKIKKESGTSGFFNPIPSDVVTYIFEYTGSVTGGGTTDFLGSPSSHTNRIINIINVSDVDYFLGFMTNKPYTKTSTQLNQVDYGQSITVQSDGSKWWVISRNF
jgi:hypothetical protein